jgi:LysR family cyn operon transcriptional activator
VELRHLRYFLAIADTLSFTRAAAKLRITQPALSHQIKQLEQEIGTPLFDRSGARLRLTAEGEVMKTCAEQAFRVIDSGLAAVSDLNGLVRGEVKVAVFHAFGHSLLPPLLGRFMETYPGIRVRVRQASRVDMERELIAGAIDFAIGYSPAASSQIVEEELFTESFALAVGRRHPWFRRKRPDAGALQDERLVLLTQDHPSRALVGGWLRSRGIVPRVVAEMDSNEAVLAMVRSSALATLLPERVVSGAPDVRTVRIDDVALTRTAAIFWHRHGYRSAAARVLSDLVKSAYAPARGRAAQG